MQLHQLFVFIKVAERRSFSRAAEDIFLSQSTVSTHISSLENYFGQKLFDRLGKEVVLTPFGERLYYWGEKLLKLKDKALWDLREWTGLLEGSIKVGAGTVPAQYIAPYLMSQFLIKHPGIIFSLTQNSSELVAESLLKGDVDLGILGDMYYEDKLTYIPFIDEHLVLITYPDLTLEEPVSIFSLLNHPFIFRKAGSGTQAVLEKLLRQSNVAFNKLRVIAFFDNVQSIKQAVKDGMGLAIISEIAALDYKQSGFINAYQLEELKEKRMFYFAYNKKKTLPSYIEEFIFFSKNLINFYPGLEMRY